MFQKLCVCMCVSLLTDNFTYIATVYIQHCVIGKHAYFGKLDILNYIIYVQYKQKRTEHCCLWNSKVINNVCTLYIFIFLNSPWKLKVCLLTHLCSELRILQNIWLLHSVEKCFRTQKWQKEWGFCYLIEHKILLFAMANILVLPKILKF